MVSRGDGISGVGDPYIDLTIFEILFIPVRNVTFFVYLFTGTLIYITVVVFTRVDRTGSRCRWLERSAE